MKITSKILVLVLACMMLLTSCGTDDKKEENKATAPATATVTAMALSTEAPTATATIEPTTEATKVPVTETPDNPVTTEETTATTKPTKNPSIIVQPTDKATEKPTVKPTSKPTVSPTNKPTETAKPTTPVPTTTPTPTATAKPTPTLDPSVDYSEWGKHGFENLLPIPLPFSDEEADWRSKKESQTYFKVKNFKMIYFENNDDFVSAIKEYAESLESLGYTLVSEKYIFRAYSQTELFKLTCSAHGYVSIEISLW